MAELVLGDILHTVCGLTEKQEWSKENKEACGSKKVKKNEERKLE